MFQRRERRGNYGVYLLAMQLMSNGPIPPVTLAAIAIQVAIYLGFLPVLGLEQTRDLCLLPVRVVARGEWYRLLAPVIMHADDMHLYYNMIALLYKGKKLEDLFGSYGFGIILGVFSIASTLMTVLVSFAIDTVFQTEYMYQCAVGFSGVLFALKVLVNSYYPDADQRIFGWFPIPSRFACWAELVLIQVLSPNVSFVGHLAGILIGLLYTWGPLRCICNFLTGRTMHQPRHRGVYATAPPEEDETNDEMFSGRGETWGRRPHYQDYTGGLSEEEQLRHATDESLRGYGNDPWVPPPTNQPRRRGYGWNID